MMEIGGYFGLELSNGKEYHQGAIALNTGRNALEVILSERKFQKVFIPFYNCDAVIEPFIKTSTPYEFYQIDKNLKPSISRTFQKDEALMLVNYFGIQKDIAKQWMYKCDNIIVDNTQAFFDKPCPWADCFYSCRKFFGVPDGAYLYPYKPISKRHYDLDVSVMRISSLLRRIEYGAESGFLDHKYNEVGLNNQPIKQMSKFTSALLKNIDYDKCRVSRVLNFEMLHDALRGINELECIHSIDMEAPMVYPLLIKSESLRSKLISHKVFVATYWPEIVKDVDDDTWEFYLAKYLLPLPIDQRYGREEMKYIVDVIIK
jgi:hypothetical protein